MLNKAALEALILRSVFWTSSSACSYSCFHSDLSCDPASRGASDPGNRSPPIPNGVLEYLEKELRNLNPAQPLPAWPPGHVWPPLQHPVLPGL